MLIPKNVLRYASVNIYLNNEFVNVAVLIICETHIQFKITPFAPLFNTG